MAERYVESLNAALHRLMDADDRVFVLGEDVLDPYGGAFKVTRGLSTAYPDRVLTTPISEAAICGFATGLALRGLRPVLEIMFGDFVALCADQLVNGATKFAWMYNGQVEAPLVVRTPMGGRRGYGPTHSQTLETLFLGTPGLTILAPSHFHDPGALLEHAVRDADAPVLFIENKLLYPQRLIRPDARGRAGDFFVEELTHAHAKRPTLRLTAAPDEPPAVTLIAYGGMAPLAAEAALGVFMADELVVEVLVPSQVKPLPLADLLPSARRSGRVVVAEEGMRAAGWGAELAARLTSAAWGHLRGPVIRLGARDVPIPSARTLEDVVLVQVEDIQRALRAAARGETHAG